VTPAPANCVRQVYGASKSDNEQYGVYGQVRLSPIEGFTLVGGGRFTWWDTKSTTLLPTATAPTGYGFHGRFTPYVGAVWDVTDQLNLYASYADSFTPQTSSIPRADGQPIEPLIGSQYEAGSKLALFDEKLLLSLAAYEITQSNRIFTDPVDTTVIYQIGKVRARGIEAEAHGEILPGWKVNGGYSYTKTKYLSGVSASLEGISLVPVIPQHSVKLFTNYAPTSGSLAGFSAGGGLTWFSKTWGGNAATFNSAGTLLTRSTIVRQGSYAVLDLRAGYKLNERLAFSVNVNNALDRTYYARISATGRGNFYASPRTILATVRYSFP
jgi:outer membrane receptor for ferric coprogen and ferric-rhodotorulic acid